MMLVYIYFGLAELAILLLSVILSMDEFLSMFGLINLFCIPSAYVAIKSDWPVIKMYYRKELYRYNQYFKNEKIKEVHDYICKNIDKLPKESAHFDNRSFGIDDNSRRMNDRVTSLYRNYERKISGEREEFLLRKVIYHKDTLLWDDGFFRNMKLNYEEPFYYLLDAVYADVLTKNTYLKMTAQQYDYYKILISVIPHEDLKCIYAYANFKRRFFPLFFFSLIFMIILIAFTPLVVALVIILATCYFLYAITHD